VCENDKHKHPKVFDVTYRRAGSDTWHENMEACFERPNKLLIMSTTAMLGTNPVKERITISTDHILNTNIPTRTLGSYQADIGVGAQGVMELIFPLPDNRSAFQNSWEHLIKISANAAMSGTNMLSKKNITRKSAPGIGKKVNNGSAHMAKFLKALRRSPKLSMKAHRRLRAPIKPCYPNPSLPQP